MTPLALAGIIAAMIAAASWLGSRESRDGGF
jgi:hypothetical protein